MSRPRILYLAHQFPHEKTFGGQLRTLQVGRLLQQCGDVSLVVVPLLGEVDGGALSKTQAEFRVEAVLEFKPWPIRGIGARLRHELDAWCLNTYGKALTNDSVSRIRELVAAHDLVWFQGMVIPNGTRISQWPRAVLDINDVYSQYCLTAMRWERSIVERVLAFRRLWMWRRREATLLKRFGILGVCSEADRKYLGSSDRIHVIPNGFERPAFKPRRKADPPRIGFIGVVRYPPNLDGINWFIDDIWPKIKDEYPDVRLRLVGSGTESEQVRKGRDIDGLGWVDDAAAEIATWSLMVVPVRIGAGTRIKIAEGFGRKCPVVSTGLGAFGYDVTSGREILLADREEEFARACSSILRDPAKAERMAECAWEKYLKNWAWDAIGPRVAAAVEHGLRLPASGSAALAETAARACSG